MGGGRKRHLGQDPGQRSRAATTTLSLSRVLQPLRRLQVQTILEAATLYASQIRLVVALVVKEHIRLEMRIVPPGGELPFVPDHNYYGRALSVTVHGQVRRPFPPYLETLQIARGNILATLPLPVDHSGLSASGMRCIMNRLVKQLSENLATHAQERAEQLQKNHTTNMLLGLLTNTEFADFPERKRLVARERGKVRSIVYVHIQSDHSAVLFSSFCRACFL
jgi:hypothetical protein